MLVLNGPAVWCPTLNCVTLGGGAKARDMIKELEFPARSKAGQGNRAGGTDGRGLHSFTSHLNLSRFCH